MFISSLSSTNYIRSSRVYY